MCAVCIAVYISEIQSADLASPRFCGFWRNRCQNTTHIPREKNVVVPFCSSITPISSLVKLCGNRLPLTPRVSELGGLAFPTKTVRENRVGVSKIFAPPPEICDLLVGATHRARADPPKCQKTRPQTCGGKRPTLGMRAWSSNAPPRAVLGQRA